ncbi:PD-(D/E)XK nuclease family protein [Nocardia donostiensis]|uniref:PD-(D/E)XK nuclease family protein n=1 Tax=Nocardia donostiensis TaxID=1538463 RepID=UPI003F5DDB84
MFATTSDRLVGPRPGPGLWQVLGGPGTGKTSLLIDLAATRIAEGADPETVLLLTHSKQAAGAVRDAITERLSSGRAGYSFALGEEMDGASACAAGQGPHSGRSRQAGGSARAGDNAAGPDAALFDLSALPDAPAGPTGAAGAAAADAGPGWPAAGVPGATREPLVRTVHSYAFAVLRRHAAAHGNPPPRLLTGAEQDAVLREMLRGDLIDIAEGATGLWPERLHQALGTTGFADQLRDLMLRATERGFGPEDLVRLGRERDTPEWVAAGRFAARYEQAMLLRWSVGVEAPEASAPALNAAELVGAALDVLAADIDLLATERARIRYLLVDDAQHLDPQAAVLVRVLAAGAGTTVVAGDPDQGVFTFRGADPRFLTNLDVPRHQRIVLRDNHRSGPAIRVAAARVAAGLPGAAPHRLTVADVRAEHTGEDHPRDRDAGAERTGDADNRRGQRGRVAAGEDFALPRTPARTDGGPGTHAEDGGDPAPRRGPGPKPHRAVAGPGGNRDCAPVEHPADVRVRVLGSPAKEAALVADHLRRAHLTQGVPWSEMAVVVRSVPLLLPPLRRALLAAGVPVRQPAIDTPLARRRGASWMLLSLRAILAGEAIRRGKDTEALFGIDDALDLLAGPLGSADQISLRRLRRGIRRTAVELARTNDDRPTEGDGRASESEAQGPEEPGIGDDPRWDGKPAHDRPNDNGGVPGVDRLRAAAAGESGAFGLDLIPASAGAGGGRWDATAGSTGDEGSLFDDVVAPEPPEDEPPLPDPAGYDTEPDWTAEDLVRIADDADWYGIEPDWRADYDPWDGLPPDRPDDEWDEPSIDDPAANAGQGTDPTGPATQAPVRAEPRQTDRTRATPETTLGDPASTIGSRGQSPADNAHRTAAPPKTELDSVDRGFSRPDPRSGEYVEPRHHLDGTGETHAAAGTELLDQPSAEVLRALLIGAGDQRILAGLTEVESAPLRRVLDALERGRRVRRRGGGLEDVLWALWTGSRLERRWAAQSERGGAAGMQADRDLDAAVALFDAAAAYVDRLPGAGIEGFVEYLTHLEIPNDRAAASRQTDAVELLSAHAAAGREWEVVAVAGVQEGIWPDPRPHGTLLHTEELVDLAAGIAGERVSRAAPILAAERKLLLVACSRARRSLLVTAVETVTGDRDLVPSRFLAELLGHDDDGAPGALPIAEPGRALMMHALVAELRGVVCNPEADAERRRRAAHQLARLAVAGVPGTRPEEWYGTAELSSGQPLWTDDDGPVALSPSTVELLQTCPLRWALERNGGSDGGNPHAVKGNLVHTLVQALAGKVPPAQVRAALDHAWQAVDPGTGWYSRQERRRVEAMLDNFMAWVDNTRGELTQAGIEVPVDCVLPARDDTERPVRIRGRVDRVERDAAGRFVIVDVKTGTTQLTQQAALEHAQLATYQVAAAHGALEPEPEGRQPDRLREPGGARLVYVANATAKGVAKQVKQPPLDEAGVRKWRDAIHAAAAATQGPSFLAMRNDGCRHCTVAGSCPVQDTGRQVTDE